MYVVVVGCGGIGARFAYSQVAAGHEVVMIDTDELRIEKVNASMGDIAMLGDATVADTLIDAGISRADAFVTTTGDDATNLAACQLAKFGFNVEKVISLVNESADAQLFTIGGVDTVLSRTDIILANLAGTLLDHPMAELMRINDRNEKLVTMKVPQNARSVGNQIRNLPLPYGVIIPLIISRVGTPFVPNEDTVIIGGEVIIASCPHESLDELSYTLTGQSFFIIAY